MALSSLSAQRIQWSFIIAIIADTTILSAHD